MRLMGQLRSGWFAAPPDAVAMIAAQLQAPAAPFTILDPCAGTGAALRQLAELLGCPMENTFAVELDEQRAEECRLALPGAKVLGPASVFGCRATYGSFSFALVNPPFDSELSDSGRTEADFLATVTEWLMPGGMLAFVCPERVIGAYTNARQQLRQWYERVTVLPFPEHCRDFNEVVVLAVKRSEPVQVSGYATGGWDEAPEGHVYRIPAGDGPRVFRKVEPTEAEWRQLLAASPLRKHLAVSPPARVPSPPLALGSGHIALLLASGHLDGLVCPPGEGPHAVRGVSRKVEYVASETENEDEKGRVTRKTVKSERIQLVVRTVDATGALRTFADGDKGEAQ
jgi:predicted RNA methylase